MKLKIYWFGIAIFAMMLSSDLFAQVSQNIVFSLPSGTPFEMIYVKGGSFTMGCTQEQNNCDKDEYPVLNVELSDFYIGEFEVTQGLWEEVMETTLADQLKISNYTETFGEGANYPMYYVSYAESVEFCRRLNKILEDTLPKNFRFRLPTEAQWEYAARGGANERPTKYAGSNLLKEVGWYKDNSGEGTNPVGLLKCNELGVYDMTGNVWEWCLDWYRNGQYQKQTTKDPVNFVINSFRVNRGGSWNFDSVRCRITNRDANAPTDRGGNLGFRLALVSIETPR